MATAKKDIQYWRWETNQIALTKDKVSRDQTKDEQVSDSKNKEKRKYSRNTENEKMAGPMNLGVREK